MRLRLDPVGQARIVYFNCSAEEDDGPEIILVRPNETPASHFFTGRFWENLGVSTLATYLENAGVRFGVLEASLFQASRARTIELVACRAPRMVGISVFSTDLLEEAIAIASGVKRLHPGTVTVLGGHGASFVHREILADNRDIDVVVRGEGERSLLALVRAPDRAAWSTIPGIAFRAEDGSLIVTPQQPIERNLDDAPLPHRFVRDIASTDPVLALSPLMLVSSRGCFDRCAFCTITQFYGGTWRGRSVEHVVDELEFMVRRYNRRSLHFWDDTFIGPGTRGRQRAIRIAEEIKRRKLNLVFHVTTRPSDLREDVVQALAAAGLRSVFLGVESSDQGTLDYFGKHAVVDDARRAIDMLRRNGARRILAGFILFHPNMSWKTFRQDLDFLASLPFVEMSRIVSRLTHYPGSRFWQENRDRLGRDAYKRYVMPDLPHPALESIYRTCLSFNASTMSFESICVALEEQHLDDAGAIDALADQRSHLFAFVADRVHAAADRHEAGEPSPEQEELFRGEIYRETLRALEALERRFRGSYFDLLLQAHRMSGFAKRLRAVA